MWTKLLLVNGQQGAQDVGFVLPAVLIMIGILALYVGPLFSSTFGESDTGSEPMSYDEAMYVVETSASCVAEMLHKKLAKNTEMEELPADNDLPEDENSDDQTAEASAYARLNSTSSENREDQTKKPGPSRALYTTRGESSESRTAESEPLMISNSTRGDASTRPAQPGSESEPIVPATSSTSSLMTFFFCMFTGAYLCNKKFVRMQSTPRTCVVKSKVRPTRLKSKASMLGAYHRTAR